MVTDWNDSNGAGNHFKVVFRCTGSAWPKVLPFCIANVIWMIGWTQLARIRGLQLGISGQAHTFAAMIVSFLVVSRINTASARYSECQGYIGTMYRESRELIQNMLVFSRKYKNATVESKEWRMEVSYRMLMMLRTSVAVIQYKSTGVPAWEVPELTGPELEYCTPSASWRRHAQTPHSPHHDSMRVPLLMAYLLRESIASQEERLPHPISPIQENKLLGSIDSFLQGYYGMRKLITTPVPFPLIQMTRTIVLLYVFTLPLVFLTTSAGPDDSSLVENCAAVFLLTYGFMGLEIVSIELDDPSFICTISDAANDIMIVNVLGFAQTVFEDTFMMIHDADGESWADALRYKMHQNAQEPLSPTELTGLLNTSSMT